MAIRITRVLVQGIDDASPGQSLVIRDQATETVLASGSSDPGTGAFSFPLPFELYLQAVAAGHGDASGVFQQDGTATGLAGGRGGASGLLSQSLPLSGSAGGQGAAAGGPSQPLAGEAAGHADGSGTPAVTLPGSQSGTAGGDAEATGALSVNVPLGGSAGGHASAGPSTQAQQLPISGAAAGQGGASGVLSAGPALSGAAAGVGGASASGLTVQAGGAGFTDDFSTNTIASYTLSGTLSSGLSVTGGKLQHYNAGDIGTGGSANAERTGFSLTDGTVRATLKAGADLNGGLAAAGNVMSVYARWSTKFVGAQVFSGGLRLVQSDGTFSVLGTYAFAPSLNTDYVVEVVVSGSSVVVNLNGTQRITGTTTVLAAGTAAVSFERGSWDDGMDYYTNGGTYYADDLYAG